jgi:hypothetical protein
MRKIVKDSDFHNDFHLSSNPNTAFTIYTQKNYICGLVEITGKHGFIPHRYFRRSHLETC